jgi:secreted trypsin-like serine protease
MNYVIRTLSLALTVTLIACGGGGDGGDTGSCGDISSKVTGGTSCNPQGSSVVALVAVKVQGENLVALGSCSATVVTNDDILTAAHCIATPLTQGADGFVVVTGNGSYPVTRYKVNPYYGGTGSPFDTAMVTVGQSLGLSPLPINVTDVVSTGEEINIFGYGDDENGSSFLQEGLSALKSGRMIVGLTEPGRFAAAFNETGSAICQGDSGGPVLQVLGGVPSIVGVTSVTINGCLQDSVSGFVSMQVRGNAEFVRGYAGDVTFR